MGILVSRRLTALIAVSYVGVEELGFLFGQVVLEAAYQRLLEEADITLR